MAMSASHRCVAASRSKKIPDRITDADGILGTPTREAISVFQQQQGHSGHRQHRRSHGFIAWRVSGRLSQQANQSLSQSQSSTTGAQTSTGSHGQAQMGQQQPSQQNAATAVEH
jgi:hypothetical protein